MDSTLFVPVDHFLVTLCLVEGSWGISSPLSPQTGSVFPSCLSLCQHKMNSVGRAISLPRHIKDSTENARTGLAVWNLHRRYGFHCAVFLYPHAVSMCSIQGHKIRSFSFRNNLQPPDYYSVSPSWGWENLCVCLAYTGILLVSHYSQTPSVKNGSPFLFQEAVSSRRLG